MFFSSTRFLIFTSVLLVVLYSAGECKRGGGGGRRGSVSRGSTSVWGRSRHNGHDVRNNNRKSKSQHSEDEMGGKPAEIPDSSKPSAPPSSSKAGATKPSAPSDLSQHTSGNGQQRPIGWDVGQGSRTDNVGNKNIGWNTANTNNPPNPSGTIGKSPPPYSATGSVGNPPPYSGPGGVGNPPPPYSGAAGAVNHPPPYSGPGGVGNHPPPYSGPSGVGHPPPPYSGPGGVGNHPPPYSGPSGVGHPPPPYSGPNTHYSGGGAPPGPYYSNMHGYGGAPMGGGFYGDKYNKHGYGGFGGYGGYPSFGGGYGMGGYGKKFGGGFGMGFGSHAVRNVVMGLLVWNLVSGLTRRPYNVYNYYNNPEKVPNEIPLPANIITLCPENVTSLCAPNTAPLCTSESAIMCVVLAQKTVPCDGNSTMKCVNSTAPCVDENDKPCEGKDKTTTSVNIPCVTNATIIGKVKSDAIAGLNTGNTTELCVTTLALPQSEEEKKSFEQTLCQPGNATTLENGSTKCSGTPQPYNVTTPLTVEKTEMKHNNTSS